MMGKFQIKRLERGYKLGIPTSKFINNFAVGKDMAKKGQIAIFVIIAIVIIGAAILFFTLTDIGRETIRSITPGGSSSGSFDIEAEFSTCIIDNELIDAEIREILMKGGRKNPDFFYMHEGNPYSYLCHTNEYYTACVNNNPLLLQSVEMEIDKIISPLVSDCYRDLQVKLKDQGFETRSGDLNVVIDITQGNINIKTDTTLNIKKGESSRTIDGFEIRKPSEAYQLLSVSSSIISYETLYGDSDPVAYMSLYPNTRVEKIKQSDGTTLYKVSDRTTLEEFNFATRSYAMPAGYGL